MEPNHNAVDSSALLAEINMQIRQQNLLFDMAEFDEVPLENAREAVPVGPYSAEELEEELTCLSFGQEVRTNRPLPNRGIFKWVKMVLRKLMTFYVEPIAKDISDYNRSNVQAIAQMQQQIAVLEKRLREVEAARQEEKQA